MKAMVMVAAVCLLTPSAMHAQSFRDQAFCQSKRVKAAGKFEKCVQDWLSKFYRVGGNDGKKLAKCVAKHSAEWPRLQRKGLTGTVCDGPRWVDNGLTVTDNLTGLTWEKKTDDGSVNDWDDTYSYSDYSDGTPFDEDGTAFTVFLPALNAGAGFAGINGWRIPTFAELLTLQTDTPGPGGAYIDAAFGPYTAHQDYLSTTPFVDFSLHWTVDFYLPGFPNSIAGSALLPIRAVSGGFF